jgi:putative transposase
VLDVFSRRVVGWQLSTSLRTDLALDALNMGLWTGRTTGTTPAPGHHSDRGVQYLAVRYTERLAEAGVVARLAARATATTTRWLRRSTACSRPSSSATAGPWKSIDDLEIAVAEYIDWFNFRPLHGEIALIPPVEYEALHRSTAPAQQPAERQFPLSTEPGT